SNTANFRRYHRPFSPFVDGEVGFGCAPEAVTSGGPWLEPVRVPVGALHPGSEILIAVAGVPVVHVEERGELRAAREARETPAVAADFNRIDTGIFLPLAVLVVAEVRSAGGNSEERGRLNFLNRETEPIKWIRPFGRRRWHGEREQSVLTDTHLRKTRVSGRS